MANRVQCNRCAASLRRTVLIFFDCFSNGHISGALAELIRSTRAPTKDRLKGKIMSGNPVFRGTRVPVHMLAELVLPRACARTRYEAKTLIRQRWGAPLRAAQGRDSDPLPRAVDH